MSTIAGIDLGSTSCRVAVSNDGDVQPFAHRFSEALPLLVETQAGTGDSTESSIAYVSLKQKAGAEGTIADSSGGYSVSSGITEIFRRIRDDMNFGLPNPIEGAVLAVPGFFPERARSVLRQSALDAGFPGVKLFDEALAAVMGMANLPENGSLLFYSLGAGIFSASAVKISGGKPRILASEGDRALGGLGFDMGVASLLLEKLGRSPIHSGASGPLPKLRRRAELLKMGLSKYETESCEVDFLEVFAERGSAALTLTRDELEKLIEKPLEETVKLSRHALAEAGPALGSIDLILLSGGSSRIPLVEKLLAQEFSVPIVRADDLAIARGAARQGAQLEDSDWKRPDPARRDEVEAPTVAVPPAVMPAGSSTRLGEWVKMFAPYLQEAEDLWNRGQKEKAIGAFEKMMASGKSYLGTLHHEVGKLHFQEKRYKDALIEFEKAIEFNPSDKLAWQNFHEAMNRQSQQLLHAGHLSEARKMIDEALRINRKCPGCLEVKAMIEKAIRDTSFGKFRRTR